MSMSVKQFISIVGFVFISAMVSAAAVLVLQSAVRPCCPPNNRPAENVAGPYERRLAFVCRYTVAATTHILISKARAAIATENNELLELCLACTDRPAQLMAAAIANTKESAAHVTVIGTEP